MGAWGVLAFDNDEANDWAYDLEGVNDLSLVEDAFRNVETSAGGYLEQGTAACALAACEVIARLRGQRGYTNAYTEKVDRWVAGHQQRPSDELINRGNAVIDRILADESELRELWEEAGDQEWRAAVSDLRNRMAG
jgi:hypothetical protein